MVASVSLVLRTSAVYVSERMHPVARLALAVVTGGLMTALALRQSGVFASVDIYEQTKVPSTAGAGLNIPPNGARICRWLGVDLDGGIPRAPMG